MESNEQQQRKAFFDALREMYGKDLTEQELLHQRDLSSHPDGEALGGSKNFLYEVLGKDALVGHDCDKYDPSNPPPRFTCAVCNVIFEACNQGQEGEKNVTQTVLTRVFNKNYPNTVCGVVYYKKGNSAAFSWTMEKKDHVLKDNKCLTDAIQSVRDAFLDGPNGFDHYYNPKDANPNWGKTCTDQKQIQDHLYCKEHATADRSNQEVADAEGVNLRGYDSGASGGPGSSR